VAGNNEIMIMTFIFYCALTVMKLKGPAYGDEGRNNNITKCHTKQYNNNRNIFNFGENHM